MHAVVLVIHLLLALSIIGLVLIQRSEGGGLGIGGGGGGLGGLSTPKGTADALTRATAICAAGFFCTSLILGIMASANSKNRVSLLDSLSADQPAAVEQSMEEGEQDTQEQVQQEENTSNEPPAAPIAE